MFDRSRSFAALAGPALAGLALALCAAGARAQAPADHSSHGMQGAPGAASASKKGAGDAAAKSDTRARVEQINRSEGKVKLKHGAIPRLDMPAMTMVFKVQDPKLLDQVKEGEEVGVTFAKSGSSLVVSGFQK
jgi:Cu/Ag efflux protein CusF